MTHLEQAPSHLLFRLLIFPHKENVLGGHQQTMLGHLHQLGLCIKLQSTFFPTCNSQSTNLSLYHVEMSETLQTKVCARPSGRNVDSNGEGTLQQTSWWHRIFGDDHKLEVCCEKVVESVLLIFYTVRWPDQRFIPTETNKLHEL